MTVITGATGQLGAQIVERLLERVAADQIAVSVRAPSITRVVPDRVV
jgi:uncharacterized protein YbjT (DUF2867 family)